MCEHMCVHTHSHACTHMRAHMHTHEHMCTRTHEHTCVRMCAHTRTHVYTHAHIHTHAHTGAHVIHMHTHSHTCTCVCTHTCTHTCAHGMVPGWDVAAQGSLTAAERSPGREERPSDTLGLGRTAVCALSRPYPRRPRPTARGRLQTGQHHIDTSAVIVRTGMLRGKKSRHGGEGGREGRLAGAGRRRPGAGGPTVREESAQRRRVWEWRCPCGVRQGARRPWRPFLHRGLQREARADPPATRPASRPVSAGPCRLGRPFQPSVWACVSTESTEPRPASRRCSAISSPASAPTNRTTFALPGEEPGGPLCFLRGLLSLGRTRHGLSLCLGRGSDELAVPDPLTAPSPEM